VARAERVLQSAEGAESHTVSRATAWGGGLCRPLTAVPTAQERNRDVTDPGSRARARPTARPRGRSRLGSVCPDHVLVMRRPDGDLSAVARRVCVRAANMFRQLKAHLVFVWLTRP
jgi:hypothetical protein